MNKQGVFVWKADSSKGASRPPTPILKAAGGEMVLFEQPAAAGAAGATGPQAGSGGGSVSANPGQDVSGVRT